MNHYYYYQKRLCLQQRFLLDLFDRFGGGPAAVLRELTKKFETVVTGSLSELIERFQEEPKGECVLVLSGKSDEEISEEALAKWQDIGIAEHVAKYEAEGMERMEAIKAVARDRGVPKREIYKEISG